MNINAFLDFSRKAFMVCWFLLLVPPLLAQYDRVIYSGKGEIHGVASSYPLSHWTADALERDDGGDLCLKCQLPGGKIVSRQDYKVTTDVHRLGFVAGNEVIEVLYQVHGNVFYKGQTFLWKILLVSTKLDAFAEIYHLQASGPFVGPFHPARIVSVNGERILATYDSDGGDGGGCWDGYWWFDKEGPHPVDFGPIYKEIAHHTPIGSTFTEGCWAIDLDRAEIKTGVHKLSSECRACGQLGIATARFELHHGVATAAKIDFVPDPQD